MSSKSASHRVFCAFALLAALVLVSLPAEGRPVRRPPASRNSVAVYGDTVLSRLRHFVVRLWPHGATKEGTSIDPDGNHAGTSTTPSGDLIDEGTSIDPNGSN